MEINTQSELSTGYREHAKHYNERDLTEKLKALPRSAVSGVLEKALLLRELLSDEVTPTLIKGTILGVLGYFILPFDLIPDFLPGAGYVDDIAAMALVLDSVDNMVTHDIRRRARNKLPNFLKSDAKLWD